MVNPEFSHSPEATEEEAYKILLKETAEDGLVSLLIKEKGMFHDHRIREILEYVRDEVTHSIAASKIDIDRFCAIKNFRYGIYKNKINDFYRQGLPPFVDVSESDDKITDAPGAQTHAKKAINKASVDSGNFLLRLEAADELSAILGTIKFENEEHRQRLETIFNGVASGWTNKEIADELQQIEGKEEKISESAMSQVYTRLRERYLERKFPRMPKTLNGLRRLTEPTKHEARETRAGSATKYAALLSKDVGRLSGEEQTTQTKEEILVIEYLLSKRQMESLSKIGLTTRKIMRIKKRIASRLNIPIDFLDRRLDGLSKI